MTYTICMPAKGCMRHSSLHVHHSFHFWFSTSESSATCHNTASYCLSASYFLLFWSTQFSGITKIGNTINLFWDVLVIIWRMELELVRKWFLYYLKKNKKKRKRFWNISSGLGDFWGLDLNKNTTCPLLFKPHPNSEILRVMIFSDTYFERLQI